MSPRASTQTLPPTSIASASDDGVGKTARGGVLVGCGAYGVDVGSVVADGTGVSDGATVAACVGSRVAVAVGGTGVGCGSSEPQLAAAPTIARPAVVSKNAAGRCRWCLAIAADSPNSNSPNDPTIRLATRDGKRRASGVRIALAGVIRHTGRMNVAADAPLTPPDARAFADVRWTARDVLFGLFWFVGIFVLGQVAIVPLLVVYGETSGPF